MKKRISLVLALVLLLVLLAVPGSAVSFDTLAVQTGTNTYTFHVGDTFTYSYWVRLAPDVANYGETYINERMGSLGVGIPLGTLLQEFLNQMKLKNISGSVDFDPDCLDLLGVATPNLEDSTCKLFLDTDPTARLTGQAQFASGKLSRTEQTFYQRTEVLVTCTFKVKQGGATTCVHTKLDDFTVTLPGLLIHDLERNIDLVREGTVKLPYESFDTINNGKPTMVLPSLVDDLCLKLCYTEEDIPVPEDVNVTLSGLNAEGRYVNVDAVTDGTGELWFYDLPYGEYTVLSSFHKDGKNYAISDPGLSELISFPLDAKEYTFYYVEELPGETMQITLHIDWERDEGYLPMRPDYFYVQLCANGDTEDIRSQRVIGREIAEISFENVPIYQNAVPIEYSIEIQTVSTSLPLYQYEKKKIVREDGSGIDFEITGVYIGDARMLGSVRPDADGHFWDPVEGIEIEPTCTKEGGCYYICTVCHRTKYEITPPKGHTPVEDPPIEPTYISTGSTGGSHCSVCGVVLEPAQVIPKTEAIPCRLDMTGVTTSEKTAYVDGVLPCPVLDGTVMVGKENATILVMYDFNGEFEDPHQRYPTHMYLWTLKYENGVYTSTRMPNFDDILKYAGSSIRITGEKGIRMITSVPADKKNKLTTTGLDGFILEEYGTVVAWDSDLGSDQLTIDHAAAKKAYAYKLGVSDPVYKTVGGMVQYTNVLVGFTSAKCVPDLVMRPYMTLRNRTTGQVFTIYGGAILRNIGYIAYQNRNSFKPGTDSYKYIWGIIHYVYGNVYDTDYTKE